MKVGDLVKIKGAGGLELIAAIETIHPDCKPVNQIYLVGYSWPFRRSQLEVINESG
jgi:hypothetical protein